jgi:hypothetical protein
MQTSHTPPNFTWQPSTEERYDYALDVLPPAGMRSGMFLLGEPMDHSDEGEAMFSVYARIPRHDDHGNNTTEYAAGSRPITRREFKSLAPPSMWIDEEPGLLQAIGRAYVYGGEPDNIKPRWIAIGTSSVAASCPRPSSPPKPQPRRPPISSARINPSPLERVPQHGQVSRYPLGFLSRVRLDMPLEKSTRRGAGFSGRVSTLAADPIQRRSE